MEGDSENSLHRLADFEFKYIPKKEFERIVMKVREKKAKDAWSNFCQNLPAKEETNDNLQVKVTKALNDEEIQSVIGSIRKKKTAPQNVVRTPAPFFGPARKLDAASIRNERKKLSSSSDESSVESVHIVDDVVDDNVVENFVAENVVASKKSSEIKIQVQNQVNYDAESSSSSTSENEKNSLHDEMMQLCYEIEGVNGFKTSDKDDDSSVDLTLQEEKHLRNILDKTEEKIICETYEKIIDKKFDFLYEECRKSDDEDFAAPEKAQTLPAVELKQKHKKTSHGSGGDATNDNNVWRPKAENQIRKSGIRRQETKMKNDDDVFPSDVIIRKARDVGKLKRVTNEKSREDVKGVEERQQEEVVLSKVDIKAALGRITEYQTKICQSVDFLREIVEEPPEIEDMAELRKRQQRATEFSNRFARNHLYQIGRIAEEIRSLPDNPLDIASKVNVLFQVIMQGIQIYIKNVEMFIYNSYPDKLLVLIDFIINATKICFDQMVFDKRDTVIQQMMRKCNDLKRFLETNQRSFAKFSSASDQRKKSLFSQNSFAYETAQESKLSMYDAPVRKTRRPSRQAPPRSPYESQKPRSLRPSVSSVNGRVQKVVSRQDTRNRTALKSSSSNVSTVMQRMNKKKSKEVIDLMGKPEKPLEEKKQPETSTEDDLRSILINVAEEKIQQMLLPFIEQFKNAQSSMMEAPKFMIREKTVEELQSEAIKPRVTSEVPKNLQRVSSKKSTAEFIAKVPTKQQKNSDKVDRIDKNVQYLYVKSEDEKLSNQSAEPTKVLSTQASLTNQTEFNRETKIVSAKQKPPVPIVNTSKADDEIYMKKMKAMAVKERLSYIEQQSQNPLYVNDACDEPWKMMSRISDKIVDDLLKNVIADVDFGEKSFVEKFLRSEMKL